MNKPWLKNVNNSGFFYINIYEWLRGMFLICKDVLRWCQRMFQIATVIIHIKNTYFSIGVKIKK